MTTPVIIVAVLGLTLAGLYLRYTLTPQHAWRQRVMAIVNRALAESRESARRISTIESDRARARAELTNRLKDRVFQSMSVDLLKDYPGIGDATVQRLRDAGLQNIAEVRRKNLQWIEGFGPARIRDLTAAIRNLEAFAANRAADPKDPLVIGERATLEEEDRLAAQKIDEARAQGRFAEDVLKQFSRQRELADRINLLNHLVPGAFPKLTPEQLAETFEYPRFQPPVAPPPMEKPKPLPPTTPPAIEQPSAPEPTPSKPPEPPVVVERPKAVPTPVPVPAPVPEIPPAPPTPLESLKAVADLGLAMAKADGRVAASERKQLGLFLERRFAPTPELKAAVPGLIGTQPSDILSLSESLWEVKRIVSPRQFADVYLMACSIADAAGDRNAREAACLAEIRETLGINEATGQPSVAPAPSVTPVKLGEETELNESLARQTLEIGEGITLSADLVRRQFRLLTERYEHGRFAATDAEFARLAETKRKAVLAAAEYLMKPFNEPLQAPDQPKTPADDRHNPDLDAVFGG